MYAVNGKMTGLALLLAAMVSACGGGGGGSSDASNPPPTSAPEGVGTTPVTSTPPVTGTTPVTSTPPVTSIQPETGSTISNVASLPADLLSKPAAASCAALRSGAYRVIFPTRQAKLADQTGVIKVDAVTLVVTYTDGSTGKWAASTATGGACRFTDVADGTDIAVTPAGVIVARSSIGGGAYQMNFGFPEQRHTLADLAGAWSFIGMKPAENGNGYTGVTGAGTYDTVGGLSGTALCANDVTWGQTGADCAAVTTGLSTLKANSDGGFDVIEAGASAPSGRAFAYRAGGGALMVAEVEADGSFFFYTPQRARGLPPIGAITTNWNITMDRFLASPAAISESRNTVLSVDAVAGSWVRNQASANGPTFDTQATLFANNPRTGFAYRAAGQYVTAAGTTANISEFFVLGLVGMGVSSVIIPVAKQFIVSPDKP